jgi:hypothetical protein
MAKSGAAKEAVEAAFRALSAADRTDPALIATLVDAISTADSETASLASIHLSLFTPRFAEVRDAVLRMAMDRRGEVREWAMHTVNSRAPSEFGGRLARLGLADEDWRVRRRAAELVFSFRLLDLLPELERLIATEEFADVKQSMLRAVGLLQDGYFLRPEGEATVFVEYVGRRNKLCFAGVSRSAVEHEGAAAVVAALREPRGYKI